MMEPFRSERGSQATEAFAGVSATRSTTLQSM